MDGILKGQWLSKVMVVGLGAVFFWQAINSRKSQIATPRTSFLKVLA